MRRTTFLLAAALTLNACGPMTVDTDTDAAASTGDAAPNAGDSATATDGSSDADPTAPTFENVQAIIAHNCTGYCHASAASEQNAVVFDEAHDGNWTVSNLLVPSRQVPGLNVVEPGDPDRSYLIHKIENTMPTLDECRADAERCGVPMPWNGENRVMLPEADRALIRAWIAAGAPGPR